MRKVFWLAAAIAPLVAQTPALNPGQYFLLAEQARTAFTVQGSGARAMGTGGAFIAVADDATAVSFNPAGLAQLLRPELSLVGQGNSSNVALTGFTGLDASQPTTFSDTHTKDNHSGPTFASFAVPWKVDGYNYVFLASYQRLFDFNYASSSLYQATASAGATTQTIAQGVRQTGGIDLYSLALGAEISSRILLGVAVNYWLGRPEFQYASARQTSGVGVPFDSQLSQSSEFRGINANLGLMWRSQWLNFGMVYRTPFTAKYTFTNRYAYLDSSTFVPAVQAGPATSANLNWPETLGWGFAVHPNPRLMFSADWSHTPWSHTSYSAPGSSLDGMNWFDFQNPTVTRDVTDVHAGTEWVAWLGDTFVIPLRLGAFREPQPIVDTITGTQRVLEGWTLGCGIKWQNLALDLAYSDSHDRRYVSRYNTDAPVGGVAATGVGYESLGERSLYASLIYQLDGEAVRHALSWLLVGAGAKP